MKSDFLNKIIEHKQALNKKKVGLYANLKSNLLKSKYNRYRLFKKQISQSNSMNLIAEIKKASPSKGVIREDFDALAIAKVYKENNVSAISVLTEEKFFLGKHSYVKKVSEEVGASVLMKDFIIEEGQIYEAVYYGASAILLIASVLTKQAIKVFMDVASSLDLDCLVEVHNEEELVRSLEAGAEIIGINNRDLRTFDVDLKNCGRLIPIIPKDKIIVAESGIKTCDDIEYLRGLGVNAVLIGELFMRSGNIGDTIKELKL